MSEKTVEGLPVSGYQPQNRASVEAVNVNKALEELCLRRIEALEGAYVATLHEMTPVHPRWASIARTHLELAFMALNRAVFQPGRVSDKAIYAALGQDFDKTLIYSDAFGPEKA